MASPYRINLPAYEGPLDLLLDLIRKQEMDIHNIPIAKITEQYLDYLHQIEKFDIDVSADFIYMAATLIHIKSKMLLPVDPLLAGEEAKNLIVYVVLRNVVIPTKAVIHSEAREDFPGILRVQTDRAGANPVSRL